MMNLDLLNQKQLEIKTRMSDALKGDDPTAFATAFCELAEDVGQRVMDECKGLTQAADTSVLVSRGTRALTTEETNYYTKALDAMKSPDFKGALASLDVVMPETVIDSVFEDLQQNHPLLSKINFVNTTYLTTWLLNVNEAQTAQWGPLTDRFKKELASGFKKENTALYKLAAFFPIAKSMLDLGPAWLDRYVRTVLAEALAVGLETGIVTGTGKDMPIGMDRDVSDGVTVTAGVYPQKALVVITSLDPAAYGALLADHLAKTAKGNPRVVTNVLMAVNPVDYLKLVMPATTVQTPMGTYVNNVLPYPTDIVQSVAVTQGEAIFGIASRYFMGAGMNQGGKLEHDDSVSFFDDERVYAVKFYGNGKPMDDNSFVRCDISGLKPMTYRMVAASGEAIPGN